MFRRLIGFVLFAVLPLAAGELSVSQQRVLTGIARDKYSGRWTDLATNQLAELRQKAEAYDERIRERHLPGGMIASLRYASTNSDEVVSYEALEHSAAWTGLYIASCSYRYAVLRETRNLNDIRFALDGLTRAVQATGRPGVLPRFAGRGADELFQKYYSHYGGEDPARPGFGRQAYRGVGDNAHLVWLGGPSRVDYAGVNLGLATAWYYIRDAKIRGQISNVVQLVVGRMEEDDWRLDDGKSDVTFVDPVLAAAWLRTAATVDPRRFAMKYEGRVGDIIAVREDSGIAEPGLCRYCDPMPGMFRLANILALNRNETNQTRRLVFQDMLTKIWQQSQMNIDPWLAVAYLGAFDRIPVDSTARSVVQGLLYEYPAPPRWSAARDNFDDTSLEVLEVNGERFSKYALPFSKRPVAPFQWAQSPTLMKGGADEPVAHPAIDLLLAYWMGRDLGVTPSEDSVAPLELNVRPLNPRFGRTNSPIRRSSGQGTMKMNSGADTNAPAKK